MTVALLIAAALATPSFAATDVYLKLAGTSGSGALLSLAVPPFIGEQSAKTEDALLAKQLRDIIRADLLFSRYFKLLEDGPIFDGTNLERLMPEWKTRGAGWLLTAKAASAVSKLTLQVELTDLTSSETVFQRYYRQDRAYPRSVAHQAADDIVQALTGKAGIAHTRLAFANDQTGRKEIYVMDYDGENLRRMTSDRSISLLPRFSPDRKTLAYTGYKDGNPDLFFLDLERGGARLFSGEQGLNIAGGFSPDGAQMLMTLSRGKSPNLFVKNVSDGSVARLTSHTGADSSPTFSPDASQVAFVSDRSGNPQIYLLDTTTHRTKRLTAMNWCDSPSWSPTGEWIAFAGRAHYKDPMNIFLVDVTGNQIRQLTRGEGSNENPSWSPDGRFLAFTSTRRGRSEVFVMDYDGSAPHRLADIPGQSFTPNWSH